MEFLFGLVASWTWLVLFVAFVALVIAEEAYESNVGAVFVFLCTAALFWAAGGYPDVWLVVRGHWQDILLYGAIYLVGSVVYGIVKWWFFYHNKMDEYDDQRTALMKNWADLGYKDSYGGDYKKYVQQVAGFPPQISKNKMRYFRWMMWWPFSLAWTLLNDPLRRFWNFVYQRMAVMLQNMAQKAFANRFDEMK